MATGAGGAETPSMHRRLGMTTDTRLHGSLEMVVDVARGTIESDVFAGQFEGGEIVVEMFEAGQGAVGAKMLGVARSAILGVCQFAVQRSVSGDLIADVGMAGDTAAGHGGAAPGGSMARRTIAAELGMRAHAAGFGAGFVFAVEGAGAEHAAAARTTKLTRRTNKTEVFMASPLTRGLLNRQSRPLGFTWVLTLTLMLAPRHTVVSMPAITCCVVWSVNARLVSCFVSNGMSSLSCGPLNRV